MHIPQFPLSLRKLTQAARACSAGVSLAAEQIVVTSEGKRHLSVPPTSERTKTKGRCASKPTIPCWKCQVADSPRAAYDPSSAHLTPKGKGVLEQRGPCVLENRIRQPANLCGFSHMKDMRWHRIIEALTCFLGWRSTLVPNLQVLCFFGFGSFVRSLNFKHLSFWPTDFGESTTPASCCAFRDAGMPNFYPLLFTCIQKHLGCLGNPKSIY